MKEHAENQADRQAPVEPGPTAKPQDLGFGTNYARKLRFINRDGSFNVLRRGLPWFRPYDLYHKLITMSWAKFLGMIILGYLGANIFFSALYLIVGLEHLDGILGKTAGERFMDAFFFSSQTITTLGYGRMSPMGLPANIIAAVESCVGLLGFAFATGLLYGRFSRPVAKISFSKQALIAPYRDKTGFMLRLANKRSSQLIELEVQIVLTTLDPQLGKRRFQPLKLERDSINFLALSWTVVHPIDEESPLFGLDEAGLMALDAEFIILIKAFDDTFSQTIYSRTSYKFYEVEFNAAFNSIIGWEDDRVEMDVSRISDFRKV